MTELETDINLRVLHGSPSTCHGNRFEVLADLARYCLAAVFIVSGVFKAVSPEATSMMITQYLNMLGVTSELPSPGFMAVTLCVIEFLMGAVALSGRLFYYVSPLYVVAMFFFTGITFINLTSPYGAFESCGCFGEIIHLNAPETFVKNLFLLIVSILLCIRCYIK